MELESQDTAYMCVFVHVHDSQSFVNLQFQVLLLVFLLLPIVHSILTVQNAHFVY